MFSRLAVLLLLFPSQLILAATPPTEIHITDNRICSIHGNYVMGSGNVPVTITCTQSVDYSLVVGVKSPLMPIGVYVPVSAKWKCTDVYGLSFSGKGKADGFKAIVSASFVDSMGGVFVVTGSVTSPDGTIEEFSGTINPTNTARNLRFHDPQANKSNWDYSVTSPNWAFAPATVSGLVDSGACKIKGKATFLKLKASGEVSGSAFIGDAAKPAKLKLQKLKLLVDQSRITFTY